MVELKTGAKIAEFCIKCVWLEFAVRDARGTRSAVLASLS